MRTTAVDGFELEYDRSGAGLPVVLLHGWPGDRTDYRDVVPLLADRDVVVPDLRGFGASDKHSADPAEQYNAAAQARSVAGLIEELGLERPVVAGYDVGSRVAQTLAKARPDLIRAVVVTPPVPGVGKRVFEVAPQREYWYQPFHQLPLIEQLIDGNAVAVRNYLTHFWTHWAAPGFSHAPDRLDHLVEVYSRPGAFAASVAWYRSGAGTVAVSAAEVAPEPEDRISVPTTVLWPELDRLFPREWGDRLDEFFTDVTVKDVDGAGHYAPLEAPQVFAGAVRR